MNCFEFNNFRQSAPTDGRDPFAGGGFYTSKQNSDANGFRYQWGRKDPFLFATNSELWGVSNGDCGKHAVKIYTIDGVLIYQESNGSSNTDKQPVGGVIVSSTLAISMIEIIKNPTTYYGQWNTALINQSGHTKALWDYYWTSYSRGTDGKYGYKDKNWHNSYLNGYISKRIKSIFDPCPYGFKAPTNGTFNQSKFNLGWTNFNYLGGTCFIQNGTLNWFVAQGYCSVTFYYVGSWGFYRTATSSSLFSSYNFQFSYNTEFRYNNSRIVADALSVRCIDFARLVSPPRPTGEMLMAT